MAELTALEELLLKFQQENGLAVCFLVNGCYYMGDSWELIRMALRELIDRLVGENTAMSLVLFSNRVEVVHELNTDIQALNKKISSLSCPGGYSPVIPEGLKRCQALLEIYPAPVRRLVVVLTNGGNGSEEINQMRAKSISVISIGMGKDINQEQVAALASNVSYSFGLPTLPSLRLTFQRPASSLPAPVLEVTCARESTAILGVRFNNEGVSLVRLQKLEANEWETIEAKAIPGPKDTFCFFNLQGLVPKVAYSYRVLIKFISGHTLTSLPQTVTTVPTNAMTKLLTDKEKLPARVKELKDNIIALSKTFKHRVRIGLVGKVGSGKSAIANSFCSIFKDAFQYVSIVGGMGESSLTTEPKQVPLLSTNLVVTDFFGWEESNKYMSDLKHLIQGLAHDNLRDGETSSASYSAEKYSVGAELRKFYGIFFVVSPADVAQASTIAILQTLCDKINRQGLQPVILLNKVDQIDPELKENPELVYASEKVENFIKQLTSKRFSSGLIFPVISYYEPPFNNKLDDVKNYLLLSALHTLVFNSMQPKLEEGGLILPQAEQQPEPLLGSQISQASTQPDQHVQSIAQSLGSVSMNEYQPPQNNNNQCIFLVRQAGVDEIFSKCRLANRTFKALQNAIRATFNLDSDPLFIYEVRMNGNHVRMIKIGNDEDVLDLLNNAELEFKN